MHWDRRDSVHSSLQSSPHAAWSIDRICPSLWCWPRNKHFSAHLLTVSLAHYICSFRMGHGTRHWSHKCHCLPRSGRTSGAHLVALCLGLWAVSLREAPRKEVFAIRRHCDVTCDRWRPARKDTGDIISHPRKEVSITLDSPCTRIRSSPTWHDDCPHHLSSTGCCCCDDGDGSPWATDDAWLRSVRL